MVINTNLSAQNAASNLMMSQTALAKSLQKLSSGSKITSPADDSAGLAVSMQLTAQMSRITAASNNIGDAVSFNQTQDGYLQQMSNALNRMSELSVLSQDSTKTDADRALYQTEYSSLSSYINSAATNNFNGVSLFSANSLNITTDSEGNTFTMNGINISGNATYTAATSANIGTQAGAAAALTAVKAAITQLATDRAGLGANIESLGYYSDQLSSLNNNLSAANSRITDVDIAQESTNYAKENILVQSGTAMLAQANSMPNSVLKLLS